MSKNVIAGLALVAALALGSSPLRADVITPFGATVCGIGSCTLSASAGVYSGVDITFATPIALSAIVNLSATFTDVVGGATTGSPRFELYTSGADFFTVYLG